MYGGAQNGGETRPPASGKAPALRYDGERLEALRAQAGALAEPLWEALLRDMVRRVRGAAALSSAEAYRRYRAAQLRQAQRELRRAVAEQVQNADAAIDRLFAALADEIAPVAEPAMWERTDEPAQAAQTTALAEPAMWERTDEPAQAAETAQAAQPAPPAETTARELAETYAAAAKAAAAADFEHLLAPGPDGRLYAVPRACAEMMDAARRRAADTSDARRAVREATKELLRRGLRVRAADGRTERLEYAVRRAVVTRMGELFRALNQMHYDAIGADGWEVSAHAAPAPDHAPYQGRQYAAAEYERINAALRRKFGWWNCAHLVYPIRLGVSPPACTEQQRQRYLAENEAGVRYKGRRLTLYEAKQRKRALEGAVRQKKYDVLAAEGDAKLLREEQMRLQNLRRAYRAFCAETGQEPEPWRTLAEGFGHSEAGKAAWVQRRLGLHGRAAGKDDDSIEGVPIRVGKVDFSDQEKVFSTLDEYQRKFESLGHEEDISITTDGTIWHTVGTTRQVHPENIQLHYGVSLEGSYSHHNHPPKETYYSFSADDVDFFFQYGVQYQKASDDLYEYVMERTRDTKIPENAALEFRKLLFQTALDYDGTDFNVDIEGYDLVMQQLAEKYRFHYIRRRKE